jgi:rhomboid protease GluP
MRPLRGAGYLAVATPDDLPTSLPPEPVSVSLPRPVFTYAAMVFCVGAFIGVVDFGGSLRPSLLTLLCCGAKDRELILGAGEWWRLLSAGFLHGDVLHLLVNLYALRVLGPTVERLWGRRQFLLVYLGAVAAGNVASLAATPGVSVGASGGAFGLLGALGVFSTVYRRFVAPEARRGLWVNLLVVMAVNVVLGAAVPFVDNAAHAGGFVAGAVTARLLRPIPARREASCLGSLLLNSAALVAAFVTLYSLAEAIHTAQSADWILLARTEMETRSLGDGELSLAVPRDWTAQEPRGRGGPYGFVRQGVGAVEVFLPPRKEAPDAEPFARSLVNDAARHGATLVRQRDVEVAGRLGVELLFDRTVSGGTRLRSREAVFPTQSGRVVYVSFFSPQEARFRLDLLFDLMLQSVRERAEPPRAASPWEQFIANPRDPEACTSLAAYYVVQGRPEGAESLLRLALAVDPSYADAHDQMAYLYATASPPFRNPSRALRHARRALALRPDTPAYLATLAIAHEAAGDRASALAAARRAADLAPDDASYSDLVKRLGG